MVHTLIVDCDTLIAADLGLMTQPDFCNLYLDFVGTVEVQVSGNVAADVMTVVVDMEIVGFQSECNSVAVDTVVGLVVSQIVKFATSVTEHSVAQIFVDFALEPAHTVDSFACMAG